jgi:hypothetical protein
MTKIAMQKHDDPETPAITGAWGMLTKEAARWLVLPAFSYDYRLIGL